MADDSMDLPEVHSAHLSDNPNNPAGDEDSWHQQLLDYPDNSGEGEREGEGPHQLQLSHDAGGSTESTTTVHASHDDGEQQQASPGPVSSAQHAESLPGLSVASDVSKLVEGGQDRATVIFSQGDDVSGTVNGSDSDKVEEKGVDVDAEQHVDTVDVNMVDIAENKDIEADMADVERVREADVEADTMAGVDIGSDIVEMKSDLSAVDIMRDDSDGEASEKLITENNNEVDLTDIDVNTYTVEEEDMKAISLDDYHPDDGKGDNAKDETIAEPQPESEDDFEPEKKPVNDEKKVEKFQDNRKNVMQYPINSEKIKGQILAEPENLYPDVVPKDEDSDVDTKEVESGKGEEEEEEEEEKVGVEEDLAVAADDDEKHRLKHPLSPLEEEEENFMVTALCTAAEEGNLDGISTLLEEANNFDVNTRNKHGESALHMAASGGHLEVIKYLQTKDADVQQVDRSGDTAVFWAARQGHVDVIDYLKDQGLSLNSKNKSGEAPIHLAARYGQTHIIEFLCNHDADVNLQDKLGETALHIAAWHDLPPKYLALMCQKSQKIDIQNQDEESALHCAASRGNLECVRCLLTHQANINLTDKRGCTALHLATRRRHIGISLLLLHNGTNMDAVDQVNETPLHAACREGLLPVVQTMCAFGCDVETVNKAGHSPLHIIARSGHIEVARCLLLSGAEPDLPNKDGVTAEIMALAQGNNDVAELLSKLRPERRDTCIKQLTPINQPLNRIKMKVFGNSGVGKSTLIDSLKCGYFGSFFRKARLSTTNSIQAGKPRGTENGSGGSLKRHHSLPTQLSYDVVNECYTKGIDVQQVNLSGAGDLSIWEFSGYEPYFMLYDHFIGDPNCVHVIVFNLEDALELQQAQVIFWLNFIKARMAPMEPIGEGGRQPWPAKILLAATHADKLNCLKDSHSEFTSTDADAVLELAKQYFWPDFDIVNHVFVMDAHLAMSPELKVLRTQIGETKNRIVKNLPYSKGFLDAVVQALPQWRKVMGSFPVVTWPSFIEYVRAKVNLLASEEHMKEVMCQLQLVGEVIYVETDSEKDLVVLCPRWLCLDVIGQLLSHDRITHSRPTGCFTQDDFQFMLPDTEAQDLLPLLEALEICVQCDIDGDIEYEFPCLNFVETLSGLWDRDDRRIHNAVYGGLRLQCMPGMKNQIMHMFPRLQVHLRKDVLQETSAPDSDLYQWYHGSKYCNGSMEAMITLEHSDQVIDIKCRGPEDHRAALYYFMDDICDLIEEMLEDSCPGIGLIKLSLSVCQLKEHQKDVHAYSRKDMLTAQLENSTSVMFSADRSEEFVDLVAFGSQEVQDTLTLGLDLHISHLPIQARRQLSLLLDPTDPMGRDWCMLAVTVGLTEELPQLDHENNQTIRSRTDRTMERWARDRNATVRKLVTKLNDFGRTDTAEAILNLAPLYHVFQNQQSQSPDADGVKQRLQPLHDSENTLASSVSR